MAVCYHRKQAWITDKGMVFKKPPFEDCERVLLPCGKCIACRVNKASEWANRVIHESFYVAQGCFVTLTYSPEHCPADYELKKKDFQDFMKRLRIYLKRKKLGSIRSFLACGEYGSKRGRPHYHVLLLGWSPFDLVFYKYSYSGDPIYTSEVLEKIWGLGFCPVGTLTNKSAGYVARYAKKAVGDKTSRRPPFVLASRNIPLTNGEQGAIGAQWLLDNHLQLRNGYLRSPVKPEVMISIPDYYLKLLARWFPDEVATCRLASRTYAESVNCNVEIYDLCGKATPHLKVGYTPDDVASFLGCALSDLSGLDESEITLLLLERTHQLEQEQIMRLNKLRRNLHEEK